jgi:hypothetical protein
MLEYMLIIVIVFIILLILLAWKKLSNSVYVKSKIDEQFYLVRDLPDKQEVADTLAYLKTNVNKLIEYMGHKSDEFSPYIKVLQNKFNNALITENINDAMYTSYSVNKGDQLVFCVRSRKEKGKKHDINLMMYVVLHEISHIACPDYGHDDLFKKIFKYITQSAIDINIYSPIDFKNYNKEYCGMYITDSIV